MCIIIISLFFLQQPRAGLLNKLNARPTPLKYTTHKHFIYQARLLTKW
jgi:hypothetical protein